VKRLTRNLLGKFGNYLGLQRLSSQIEDAKLLTGRLLAHQLRSVGPEFGLDSVEFKVFSQFGEDGILQYLIHKCGLTEDLCTFVEFGVSDYEESNTRFLLMNNNWRGLVLDGSDDNIAHIRAQPWYWRHDLTAVQDFINAENIDALISNNGFTGAIGILSIDIDGNDYWVWQAIKSVRPAIVVAEYNSLFGASHPVTIPYDKSFMRNRAHYSNLYWGASLAALERLARGKGYVCVGSNSAGNNAFFVRQEFAGMVHAVPPAQAYVRAKFRESRDAAGALTFSAWEDRLRLIRELPVYHLDRRETVLIGEVYGV
jgi:hypothetical protein